MQVVVRVAGQILAGLPYRLAHPAGSAAYELGDHTQPGHIRRVQAHRFRREVRHIQRGDHRTRAAADFSPPGVLVQRRQCCADIDHHVFGGNRRGRSILLHITQQFDQRLARSIGLLLGDEQGGEAVIIKIRQLRSDRANRQRP